MFETIRNAWKVAELRKKLQDKEVFEEFFSTIEKLNNTIQEILKENEDILNKIQQKMGWEKPFNHIENYYKNCDDHEH